MTQTPSEAGRPRLDHRRGFTGPYTMKAIAQMTLPTIEAMITGRRIDTIDVEEEAELPGFIRRCWERDVRRIEYARARARELPPHQGILDLIRCDDGLGWASHEMSDILLYIGDAVRHLASASTREEDEEGQATGRLSCFR